MASSNGTKSTRIKILLLFVLVASFTGLLTFQLSKSNNDRSSSNSREVVPSVIVSNEILPLVARTPVLPDGDFNQHYSVEPSIWQATARRKAFQALAGAEIDVLVVPFESSTHNHDFDSTTRSLLTLTTARSLSDANIKIADPVLVAEALGIGKSIFDKSSIVELAKQTNAKQVLLSTVNHEIDNKLQLELTLYEYGGNTGKNLEDWDQFKEVKKVSRKNISFDLNNLPYTLYADLHHELLQEIFEFEFQNNLKTPYSASINLTTSINDFFSNNSTNPIENAKKLQFLALLHPRSSAEQSDKWLYQRSLIELEKVEITAEVYLLKASALAALNRRPAAVQLLSAAPDGPEKRALFEYLNGNLQLDQNFSNIADPADRISAFLRNNILASSYGHKVNESFYEELHSIEQWEHLLTDAYTNGINWNKPDHSYLKTLLDRIKPVKHLSLDSVRTRLALLRPGTANVSIEQAVLDHLETLDYQSSTTSLGVRQSDLYNLVRAQLAENVYQHVFLELIMRGLPGKARKLISLYEPLLEDQPDFSLITADTYERLSRLDSTPESQILKYFKKAQSYATTGFLHANANNTRTNFSTRLLTSLDELSIFKQRRLFRNSQWPYISCSPKLISSEQCIDNSITGFGGLSGLVDRLLKSDTNQANLILSENHHRFIGHKRRLDYLHATYQQLGNKEGMELTEQELAQSVTTDWTILKRMADNARLQSRFNDAADIILSYLNSNEEINSSGLAASHHSFIPGSSMYWAGAYEAAARLYENTITHPTGSEAELSARARLATLDSDYLQASQFHYKRIQRYQSPYAMRDLMGFASLINGGEEALQLSASLTPYLTQPEVWHGSLIAHRANESTVDQQIEWIESVLSDQMSSQSPRSASLKWYAKNYLLMMTFMDRTIDSGTINRIAELIESGERQIFLSDTDIDNWTSFPKIKSLPQREQWTEKPFKSKHMTAALALESLYKNEFTEAEKLLTEQVLCHGEKDTEQFLWLCAWAASQSDRATSLSKDLESMIDETKIKLKNKSDPEGRLFDQHISLAILYGFDGRHEEALNLLYLANADHRYTEQRSLLVRYQLLEVARILFETSGHTKYKSFVLEHANNFTITDPISAYNHSFIAMLSDSRNDRVSALAVLIHLDPQSRAIATANKQEVQEALKKMKEDRLALTQNNRDGI